MTSHPRSSDRITRPSSHPSARAARRLRLLPSGDGWSLIGTDGDLVFSALGLNGRRRCLEYAQATGALTLGS